MTENLKSSLPEYHNPPVNEVVFGIQFEQLNIKTPHIGFFWEKIGKEKYPEYKEMPTLPHIVESFGESNIKQVPFGVESFESPPLPRLFFISKVKNHLIQIQQDRFLQNWRKLRNDDTYPRFNQLFPQYVESWKLFESFGKEQNLGELRPDQYELTYVNHIPCGAAWKTLKDIENIFPEIQCKIGGRFLYEPEDIFWRKVFRLPDNKGRLHVSLRLGINKETAQQLMILDLTVRGFQENMCTWFDMAHEWIVRGFADLTNKNMQTNIWKRK